MNAVSTKPFVKPEKAGLTENGIKLVTFVCTGNTCRSPMAEAVFNDMARRAGKDVRASSAGLYAAEGMPISENAARALEGAGVKSLPDNDYLSHAARRIEYTDLLLSDLVVGISANHAMALIGAFPEFASKIVSMDEDIPDPFGGDEAVYAACLEKIKKSIERMFFCDDGRI